LTCVKLISSLPPPYVRRFFFQAFVNRWWCVVKEEEEAEEEEEENKIGEKIKCDNHAFTYDCSVLDSLRFESKLANKAALLIANCELRKNSCY